jgi:hypothetical protein
MKMDEEVEKFNHNHGAHGRFSSGGGGGAGGGMHASGRALTPSENKQLNAHAISLFNHMQSKPMSARTGKNTHAATAWRTKGQSIVNHAASIMGGVHPRVAHAELQRRMGING